MQAGERSLRGVGRRATYIKILAQLACSRLLARRVKR